MWWNKEIDKPILKKEELEQNMKILQIPIEQKLTAEQKYNNAIEELKTKFLLAINDNTDEWYFSNISDKNEIIFRDIFAMERHMFSSGDHYYFYCKQVNFYKIVVDGKSNDKLVQAYDMIFKKLISELEENEFNEKTNIIYDLLEKI